MQTTLTDAVLEYQRSSCGLRPLLDRIALFVYTYPRARLGWNEDDCGEFFCYFYPKLRRLVDRFEYHGRPFEVYLIVTLKWQLRTFAGQRAAANLRVRVLTQESFWACEETDRYQLGSTAGADDVAELAITSCVRSVLKVNEQNRIEDPSSRRRVLFLALKSAPCITESLIARVALLTEYDPEWIFRLVEELKSRVQMRLMRLTRLCEKRNSSFFRMYCLQEQLRLAPDEPTRREVTRLMVQEELRLSTIFEEISRIPLSPTHRDIAEVLDVPKGTVDSGLFYLKESLRALSQ